MNDVLKRMSVMLPSFGVSGCIVVTKNRKPPMAMLKSQKVMQK